MRASKTRTGKATMAKRFLENLIVGLAGPALLVSSACDLRGFERGATVAHAWAGVGRSLSQAWGRIAEGEDVHG